MLSDLRAHAATPDEKALASIAGLADVSVRLAPGVFHRADSVDLAWQLGRLMPRLIEERQIQYYRLRSHDFGNEVRGESPPTSEADHAYVAARSEAVGEGGESESIQFTTIGLEHWTVMVDPSWLDRVEEDEFCRAASQAASDAVRTFAFRARGLKREIYSQ